MLQSPAVRLSSLVLVFAAVGAVVGAQLAFGVMGSPQGSPTASPPQVAAPLRVAAPPPSTAKAPTAPSSPAPSLPPPPPTQYCAPATPTTAADYQAAFDGLRHGGTGWATADGAIPTSLPDGRTVWTFGDTEVGSVNPDGSIDGSASLVRNSFVVQAGRCFTPLMGGSPLARRSLISAPAPNEWYWPGSGVVEGGVLRVFVMRVRLGDSSLVGLDFVPIDIEVATFSLPDLALQAIQPLPIPVSAGRPYGATVMAGPDGFVYLYAMHDRNVFVARAPLGQLLTPGAWRFAAVDPLRPSWDPDPARAVPMAWLEVPALLGSLGDGQGPSAQPWVTPYRGVYVATAKLADGLSDDVSVFTGPTPAGPWSYAGPVALRPSDGLESYGAFMMTAASNPVVVYSTNESPFSRAPFRLSIQTYGPHFVPSGGALPSTR